jgi:hypothetical protein
MVRRRINVRTEQQKAAGGAVVRTSGVRVLDASRFVLLTRLGVVMVRAAGMGVSGRFVGRMVVQAPHVHPRHDPLDEQQRARQQACQQWMRGSNHKHL